jgi:mono/diheme cytochrome c family protein
MRKTLIVLLVAVIIAAVGFGYYAQQRTIPPVELPKTTSFDANDVKLGAELAAIGNCNTCHTMSNGQPFAGGLGIATPFGTVYSTNITPDPDTGIGRWSEAAFRRALRVGVDRQRRHLYPAFPYDHFTHLTDADIHALYAFFMTRPPVSAQAPENQLEFPFNLRVVNAAWKLLYLRSGVYQPNSAKSAQWNRGAYLVEALAHCGACHTPRNSLGAEKSNDVFAGGEAEGWTAYALNQASPAPVPWDQAALARYLRSGWHDDHGIARGPMAPVIDNLASVPESEVQAIATYIADIAGTPSAERQRAAAALLDRARQHPAGTTLAPEIVGQHPPVATPGAQIYQATCAPCHDGGRPPPFGGIDLSLSTGPSGPNARNVINVVLWGLPATEAQRSPMMPGFATALTDRQIADLLTYVRSHFSRQPAWSNIEADIRDARSGKRPVMISPPHGTNPAAPVQPEARP